MGSSLTSPYRVGSQAGSNIIGNGVVVHKDGLQIGRPLVPGPGIKLKNGDGADGNPTFSILPPGHIAAAKRVPLHLAGETLVAPDVEGILNYRITHILLCNATAETSGAVTVALYTLAGKLGDAVLAPTPIGGLIDNVYTTLNLVPAIAMQRKRAAPHLFFVPEVLSPTELYVDVYVRGEILDWEIA